VDVVVADVIARVGDDDAIVDDDNVVDDDNDHDGAAGDIPMIGCRPARAARRRAVVACIYIYEAYPPLPGGAWGARRDTLARMMMTNGQSV
jgi:hypothetical protein